MVFVFFPYYAADLLWLLLANPKFAADQLKSVFKIDFSELQVHGSLGAGSFGEVCAATWRDMRVAVKRIHGILLDMDSAFAKEFDAEVQFMQAIRHPNIVLFFGAGRQPDGKHGPSFTANVPHFIMLTLFASSDDC